MLYNDWLYQWVENYVKPSVKSRTYEQYKNIIRLRLEPHLGKITLEEMFVNMARHVAISYGKTQTHVFSTIICKSVVQNTKLWL